MSRTLGAGLTTLIAADHLTLAKLWKLTRADGTVMGFTSHDRNITFGGVTYEAASALEPSAVRSSASAAIDDQEIRGLLQSAKVTEADLLAGRYDGARVEVFWVNWSLAAPSERGIDLVGTLGEIRAQDGMFVAELKSLGQRLALAIGDLTSPTCRVKELGDAECAPGGLFADGKALSFYQRTGKSVTVVTSSLNITFGATTDATAFFDYGRVLFTTGLNTGIAREIKSHVLSSGTAVVTLQEGFPFTVAVGNQATLEAGCDRRIESCRTKFQNAKNFAGEAELPGPDLALRRGRRG